MRSVAGAWKPETHRTLFLGIVALLGILIASPATAVHFSAEQWQPGYGDGTPFEEPEVIPTLPPADGGSSGGGGKDVTDPQARRYKGEERQPEDASDAMSGAAPAGHRLWARICSIWDWLSNLNDR